MKRAQTLFLRIFSQHKAILQDSTSFSSKMRVIKIAKPRSKGNTSKLYKHGKILRFFQHTLIIRVHIYIGY